MALVKCKECGQMMSDKASVCPNCGYSFRPFGSKLSERSKTIRLITWILMVLGLLLLFTILVLPQKTETQTVFDGSASTLQSEDTHESSITETYNTVNQEGMLSKEDAQVNKWDISSVEELRSKIEGTVWTCRPPGKTWFKLVFNNNRMILYFAEPQMGRWVGGGNDDVWCYEVVPSYTSDTGEKCFSIQFKKSDEKLSYGALFFIKGGDVEFNWLRGQYGGNAICKDFNWD